MPTRSLGNWNYPSSDYVIKVYIWDRSFEAHLASVFMYVTRRLKRMESEVTLLEKKLEAQQLEIQQAAVEKQEVSVDCTDPLFSLCTMSVQGSVYTV